MKRVFGPLWRGVRLLGRAGLRFSANDGPAMAGYMAYTALLALFPFLIFATALTAQLIGEERSAAAVQAMFDVVPLHVAQTLEPALRGVLDQRHGSLLTVSALAWVWVASNGIEAVRTAFDRAYGVERARNFFLRRAMSVILVMVGVLVFAALGLLIVLAPLLIGLGGDVVGWAIPFSVDVARYLFGLALIWSYLWLLHRALPSRSTGRYRLWPGVLVSVAIWMAVATGFSVYLAYAPSYTITYGTLAGVIITLLFLYLTGVAVIYGAEVNAAFNSRLAAVLDARRQATERRAARRAAAAREEAGS